MDGVTVSMSGVRFAYARGGFALDIPSLRIEPGLTLLLGPNGAGKSTLLRLAAGVERPAEGRVAIGAFDLWDSEVEARSLLAYVPDHPDLIPYASLREILLLVARLRREPEASAERALDGAGLGPLAHKTARELSLGQQRRVALAAATIGAPRVLLLDDPLEARDDAMREVVLAWIASAVARALTVLVSTHELEPFARWNPARLRIASGRLTA